MTTPTTSGLPPTGTGRKPQRRRYDWAGYITRLTQYPGQWLMLDADVDTRAVTYARSGRQPDIAPLVREIEFRTRNNVRVGPSKRGELWARYTPGKNADNGLAITDDQVAKIRRAHRDTALTREQIATKYGTSVSNVDMLIRGERRADAPGPIYGRDYTVRKARS